MTNLDLRCPQCAALVRPDAPWCTLCHADLRPAPDPEPEPDPAPDPAPDPEAPAEAAAEPDPLTAAVWPPDDLSSLAVDAAVVDAAEAAVRASTAHTGMPRTGGKHAKRPTAAPAGRSSSAGTSAGTSAAGSAEYADLVGDLSDPEVAFAILRAEGRDPFLAKVEDVMSAPGARPMLIVGGAVALAVALFVGFTLVGLILH